MRNLIDLELVEASKKYEKQAMMNRQEFIQSGERIINGAVGSSITKIMING